MRKSFHERKAKELYALGVDIGGTFTDFSLVDLETGAQDFLKLPTDHDDLSAPVLAGMTELLSASQSENPGLAYLAHGSTIAINTVIERTGTVLGLLCTEGFGDVLQLRRVRMPIPIRFDSTRPDPLIPRARVQEIAERTGPAGEVITPPDRADVLEKAELLLSGGAEAIVVALLHSYANVGNEEKVAGFIAEQWPDLPVYCSGTVLPQIREYERTMCTTLNAYVRHEVKGYVESLLVRSGKAGLRGGLYMTKSNGGCTTAADAMAQPVQTLLSGPASGIAGAADVAAGSGLRDVVTFDMGGTSTDIGIIKSGAIVMSREGQVGEFPVVVPAVEITSIGAGGSSIAYRSPSGALRVGPSSAGSRPGPACYGLGGDQATVTDALVMCGIISASSFAGGNMSLSLPAAEAVLASLGAQLGMDQHECADAIFRVAVAGLTLGVKGVMARHGLDPREFSLLAFGGAGPVFAAYVAEELGLEQIVVPARPGTLCARGALVSPVRGDFVRTVYRAMADLSDETLAEIIASLEDEAITWLKQVEGDGTDYQLDIVAAMRYRGQAWDVDVPLEAGAAGRSVSQSLVAGFHEVHNRLYGHADSAGQVELIDVHASVLAARPAPAKPDAGPAQQGQPPSAETRPVRLSGVRCEAAIYRRADLRPGQEIQGPAIIAQEDTTTVVPPGFTGTQDAAGNLILRRK